MIIKFSIFESQFRDNTKIGVMNYHYNDRNGTDNFGFTGLPAGSANYSLGTFGSITKGSYFWSSSLSPEGWGYYRNLSYSAPVFYEYMAYITGGSASYFSVRCIKN